MSYSRSSYKSSSYRTTATSSSDGLYSSRLRGTSSGDDADGSHVSTYTSRRTYNLDDGDDLTSMRTSRQSMRISSRFSTDSDLDADTSTSATTSRYSSKYKSLLSSSIADDDDDLSTSTYTRKYSRYGSRDESSDDTIGLTSTSSRLSRYRSTEGDDDLGFGSSTVTTSRRTTTRLSYLDEDDGDRRESSYSSRRFTSDSYKDSLDLSSDSYKVTTPTESIGDEIGKYSHYTFTDVSSTDDYGTGRRRYQGNTSSSTSRSLSRLDSQTKDAGQVYEAILDYEPPRSATDEIQLKEGQEVIILSKDKPHKWKVRTRKTKNFPKVIEGFAPSAYLTSKNETVEIEIETKPTSSSALDSIKTDDQPTAKDLKKKKDMIVRELIETEEDLIRDMQFVKRTYIRQSESSITPKEIKAVKDDIFNCFKDLLTFHDEVLLKNFQTLSKEPAKIGAIFLKLEDDFENHTKYSQNLPKALAILDENSDVNEFFTNYASKIRDEKTLADHLKLPSQRINDYQLLLKELSKHLSRMEENVDDLEKAIKVIATIPEKSAPTEDDEDDVIMTKSDDGPNDAKETARNLVSPTGLLGEPTDKLSKMLKNVLQAKDFFDVIESNGKAEERFIFLFKKRMFITEINKNISESQRTYNVKKIVKLPDVDIVPDENNDTTLIIKSKDLSDKTFPIGLRCKSAEQAKSWMDMINHTLNDDDDTEQSLMENDGLFVQAAADDKPTKLDENNNKLKKGLPSSQTENESTPNEVVEMVTPSTTKTTEMESSEPNIIQETEKTKMTTTTKIEDENKKESEESANDNSAETKPLERTVSRKASIKKKVPKIEDIEPPKILMPLKAITRHVGETAVFECKVSSANMNIQWLKDNKPLSGDNFRTCKNNDICCLELSNVSHDDAGLYTIVASNAKESTSSSSTLNVLSALDSRPTSPGGSFLPHAPKFKVKLKDTELLEGTTVRFEVIVRGLPIPNISIFKDGKPLKEDDHLKVLFQSKEVFEIMIEHAKPSDAGLYKCVAVNSEGQDETQGQISVSSDKNVFWGLDPNRPQSPAFKWFKDGKEFEASERFQVQFDDQEDNIVLIFQHVKPDDAGIYTCVASTSSGKISCSAELNVQGMLRELPRDPIVPEIKKQLTDINVAEGESVAILEAQVAAYPKPKVTWYKDNVAVQQSEHFKMLYEGEENYALVIKNVKSEDTAQYRLEVSNELGTVDTAAQLTVLKKPKFTQIQEKIEVLSNEKLLIEAKYESSPKLNVQWTKDGVDVKDSKRIKSVIEKDKCQLIINKASSEDAGTYKCMISNDLGKEERNVNVSVNSSPKFTKKLEAVQVMEGETAIFTGKCEAVPKAKLEFYKEAKRIESDKRIKIVEEEDGTFKLNIDKTTMEDQGKYKCVAKNKYGEEEASAELTIKKKEASPEFRDQLKDAEAMVGDENFKLSAKVDGEPKPTMKWFHNGEELKDGQKGVHIVNDEQGSTLIIDKVSPDDHGTYLCKAENACGQMQSSSNLTVKGPPYVVKHLSNVEAATDLDVSLNAIIKGNPTPQVKWYHDEKEIKMDKRKSYKYDEASAEYSLTIKKLENDDIGEYKLEASNQYGKCTTMSKVDIVSKPLFTKVLKNIVCKEMEANIEMVVQLDKKSAQSLVKWFKDDKEIIDSDKRVKMIHEKLDNSYKLVILKATEEMVGKYKCIASNDFGTTETAAKFDVITKPKFVKGLENLQVLEGDHVSMTVQIAGFPKPDVAFYKDGKDVSAEATIVVKKEMDDLYVLEMENIRIIMSGEYECRIRNEAGEAKSFGIVTVNGKPKITKDLTDINASSGEDIALEVVITGNPSPDVKWFVNGKPTNGSERILLDTRDEIYALKIPNADESDSGVYHCVASNDFGKCDSEKSNVKVIKQESAPVFTKHIQAEEIAVMDDNVRFEAQVSATPKADVTWCKDGVPLKANDKILITQDGNTHVLIVKDLKIADSGVITCRAENSKGFATDTAKLIVQEPTLPSISGLCDASVVDGDPLKVEAIVTGFPKPYVHWYKDGEYVDSQLVYSEPQNDRYQLNFSNVNSDMAGTYTCTAVNCAGEATDCFKIDIVGKKPTFVKELEESIVMSVSKENTKLKLGQNAIFETIVDGAPTPDVSWLKNGQKLTPNNRVTINSVDNEHRLEIKEITKNDVAQYTCKAENVYGEAQSVCLLKFLNEPHEPIIKKPLEDMKVEEGSFINLLCKVDGEPMPAVKWYKNDLPLEHNDRTKITSKTDGTCSLEIASPIIDDTGSYEVRAENAKGQASTKANLLVEKPQRPPQFTNPLKETVKVEFNCPLILEATVFGLPPPQIEWTKDGEPIDEATSPQIHTSIDDTVGECKLLIDHAKSDDSGNYALRATNPNGEALTSTIVKVMPEPFAPMVLENLPIRVQVVEGEPISLHAKVDSYPLPKVTWNKDRKPIDESDESIQMVAKPDGNLDLKIEPSKIVDTGVYSVTVENTVGEVTISTQVDVLSPSDSAKTCIAKPLPAKIDVVEGKEPLILTAHLAGVEPKDAKWVKDGIEIKPDNVNATVQAKDGVYSLSIDKPLINDSGAYALIVRTNDGEKLQTQSEVQVNKGKYMDPAKTCIAKPLPAKMDVVEGKEPLILTAHLAGVEPKDVKWVKDGIEIKSDNVNAAIKAKDGVYSLSIDKPLTTDSGAYALIVRTNDGEKLQTQSEVQVNKGKGPFKVLECLPSYKTVQPGEDLQLSMKIDSTDLSPQSVHIFKDDMPLIMNDDGTNGAKVSTNDLGEVQMLHAKCVPDDSGLYRIEVETPDGKLSNTCQVQVIDKKPAGPTFGKDLKGMEVESGQPCRLECVIEGNPSDFSISWFKDGEEIVPNEHYGLVKEPNGTLALLIDSFSAKDAGQYSVKVKDSTGESISEAKVALKSDMNKAKPTFIDLLNDLSVEERSPLVLKAKVVSSLPFEYKWFRNNQELKASDKIKFAKLSDGSVILQIDNATMGDAGSYKLEVSNDSGKSESQAKVNVVPKEHKPMNILQGLSPITLTAGESGSIEMRLDSDLEGDIKFLHNGKQVVPNNRVHIQKLPDGLIKLSFDNVLLEDQGDYTAIFSNNDGQVESSCPVTVMCKPIITKSLSNLTVKDGCSAKFEVAVKGNPTPTVNWLKNGLDMSTESRQITRLDNDDGSHIMQLDKCNIRDDAEYSVLASNDLGEDSCSARLNVVSSDKFEECSPTFIQGLNDMTAKKGDTFSLIAKIKAHPVPNVVWKKDGKVINKSDRVMIQFDGTTAQLTISNADLSDFGSYELSVTNALGECNSKANVTAMKECAPKFVKRLEDTEADVKVQLKLSCRVEANPEAEIFWLFNGKIIESGVKYSIFKELDELVLIIYNPTEIDSGNYECRAQNNLGTDRTEASVHFIERDKKGEAATFLTKLNDYDVLLGGKARFSACVIGKPRPTITWFKDGNEITIDNDKYFVDYMENGMIHFEVRNVTNADIGKYRCHASNIYGYDNSIAQLNLETVDGLDRTEKAHKSNKSQIRALDADDVDYQVSGLPVPLPDQPKITKMTDTSLTLIWHPSIPEQPRFPVSYVVEFGKVSDGQWVIYQSDVKDTKCDVTGLELFEDYHFRIRVENKFGVSEPSPSVTAFRSNLKPAHEPKEFKPTDYEVPHSAKEKIAAAPKFLREEENFMYGICGQPVTIEFWVYGYPEPNITWMFENEKIEHNERFNFMQDRNGKVCLFINKMELSDVGHFTCVAKNEHGEERKTIKLVQAEPPLFTKRLDETTVMGRNHIRLNVMFNGIPEPTIKWFKDFQPLYDTSRMVINTSSDQSTLTISDCITRDMGLYSCTATNLAGSTTTAAFVHVTESDINYSKYPSNYAKTVKPQNKSIEQFYDLGDELGRGTQGITYHAVERSTGKSFAAKMMHGVGETKQFMMAELEAMNQLGSHEKLIQLRDAFTSTPYSLSLITDMCGGGTLLDFILKRNQLTENEVASYTRQILEGLHYMHHKNIGHFGLTIGDILMERINGPDVRICDFGLAQRVIPGMKHYVEYGHPEFTSPEIVSKNSVTFTTDVWSSGIITYIMLTGISPFLAENDRATLQNIQNKKLDLSDERLKNVSNEGKDFLRKVLDYDPINRLDVKSALNHPWLKLSEHPEGGNQLNVMNNLREYQSRYNKWYENASCKRYYRRRELHSCYTHPSRMIYPPDEQYSPLVSPDREIRKYNKTISPFENFHAPNAYESENFQSESHYQSGPDTYLLQLRDTAFPARIRRYLRIAATNSPSMSYNLKQAHWGSSITAPITGHIPQVSIKERRKFIDVMDEEITDEKRGLTNRTKPMRLVRELGTSSYAYGHMSGMRRDAKLTSSNEDDASATKPFFREKLKDTAFLSGENVVMTCYAIGSPEPTYTWFRNDSILIESSRVEVKRTNDGRCQLKLKPGREYDVAVYKCVARNSQGSVVCRARLNLGSVCEHLNPPTIKDGSAHSILLAWTMPRMMGNSYVKCYRLEYKRIDEENWLIVDSNIVNEYYLVNDLAQDTSYVFRISACNKFGWSVPSGPSEVARTLTTDEDKKITIPMNMQFVCSTIDGHADNIDEQTIPNIDYSIETNPIQLLKSEFKELYDFKSLIMKGKFSVISRAYIKDGSRSTLACKCVLSQSESEACIANEYEIMKSLAHEKIVKLCYANKDSNVFSLASELLPGLNVLTHFSRKQFYTEECVCKVICQVLDALEYLHYRGIALIELQPDNVLIADDRRLLVKLTDFANARHVGRDGTKVSVMANPEYIAPELIKNEEVTIPYTDIWGVGVLTYILLSGHSPFRSNDPKETAQNVVYVRYMFDRIYPEVTQEAIRFILTVFKLTPHKRPTIEECHESKWLLPNDFMIKKRHLATFSSAKLNAFTEEFLSQKQSTNSRLLDLININE